MEKILAILCVLISSAAAIPTLDRSEASQFLSRKRRANSGGIEEIQEGNQPHYDQCHKGDTMCIFLQRIFGMHLKHLVDKAFQPKETANECIKFVRGYLCFGTPP